MTIDPLAVPQLILLVKEYGVPLSWQKIYLRGFHIGGELELPIMGAFTVDPEWPESLRVKVDNLPQVSALAALRYSLNFHLNLIERSTGVPSDLEVA
jgi:hypothetical protein